MTKHTTLTSSAALALLLFASPYGASARDASASRDIDASDASLTERLQAVKDKLMNQETVSTSTSSGATLASRLTSLKDSVLGASFDTDAAKETLLSKLQPTLLERVKQKITGHPTSAERIQGAVEDVASQYGIDASVLQSYASKWGVTAENLNAKTDELRAALLSKTEPTLLEKVRQKLTGHPTNTERITGAIQDVATEYGVDPASLQSYASSWGITAENLQNKAEDVKSALLAKTEPTILEKLQQKLTGHPTNAERAQGAISELATQYGVSADNIRSIASKHGIELPSSAGEAVQQAKDTASDAVDSASNSGLWSSLKNTFAGTKVEQILSSLSPEEREARLHKARVSAEAHDALDEALEKLHGAHSGRRVEKVDVNLSEKTAGYFDGLKDKLTGGSASASDSASSYASQFSAKIASLKDSAVGAAQPSRSQQISDTLASYKDKILSGSLTKEQLEEQIGAQPTIREKIQRALTGHPTDAERAKGAAEDAADAYGVKETIAAYYDYVKASAGRAADKAKEAVGVAQAEVEPTLFERIQMRVTGHPTAAERAQGAASNLADKAGVDRGYFANIKDKLTGATPVTSSSYTDQFKAKIASLKDSAVGAAQPSRSQQISDTLASYKDKILSGSLTKEQLEEQIGAQPTIREKIQRALTGHPTDAERAKGAAENLADSYGIKETVAAYYDYVKNSAGRAADKAKQYAGAAQAEVEPTLFEKIQYSITGHPTAVERAQGAASNLASNLGLDKSADAAAERAKEASVDLKAKAQDLAGRAQAAAEPSLYDKVKAKLTGTATTADRVQGAADDAKAYASNLQDKAAETLGLDTGSTLTDRIKSSLGFKPASLSDRLAAAATDLQTRAKELLHTEPSSSEKLQAAATDLQAKAKEALGYHEDTWAEKLQHTITDLRTRAQTALSRGEPTTAEKLQASADQLSASLKAKAADVQSALSGEQHEPTIGEKVKSYFGGSASGEKVVVDKAKLEQAQASATEAQAKVKAAKKSASKL